MNKEHMSNPEFHIYSDRQYKKEATHAWQNVLKISQNKSGPEKIFPQRDGSYTYVKIVDGALITEKIDKKEAFIIQERIKSQKSIRVEPVPIVKGTLLTERQKLVFDDRYAMKDEQGRQIEFWPEQMWRRVAKAIANIEETEEKRQLWEKQFYRVLEGFKFIPGGRILSGAGTGYEVTYYNCYVVPSPKDSRWGIMESVASTCEIYARGGGVGVNLSSLRPEGARVAKVNGTSSGPMNWAELYSIVSHDIANQGGSRRGALMLMIDDWHPDVWSADPQKQKNKFITVKNNPGRLIGANLSVCVSDEFMEAVKNDGLWTTKFPDTSDPDYDELWDGDIKKWEAAGKPVKIYETFRARDMLKAMAESYWSSAEPGVVFMDRYNEWSNTWYFEKIRCVNPCGEQGLPAWGVCNLGSMNLSAYVKGELGNGSFDFEGLAQDVKIAVRFLDNVIDANNYFNSENIKAQKNVRRQGLGTTGLAHALVKLGVKYGSEESLKVIEEIYKTIRDAAYEASIELAAEKGPFPDFDKEKYLQGRFIQQLPDNLRKKIKEYGIRNGVLLTQAPTGSTSELANTTSGIEPMIALQWERKDRLGERIIRDPLYEKWLADHPGEDKPDYFITSHELTPQEHLKVQAVVQKYTDSSISKTINAPESISVDEIADLVVLAYDLGLKGFTFYRDGSRDHVLKPIDERNDGDVGEEELKLRPRKNELPSKSIRTETPVGTAWIHINRDPEQANSIVDLFVSIGKPGTDINAYGDAFARLISMTFRLTPAAQYEKVAEIIINQLKDIGGAETIGFGENKVKSLADAISKALAKEVGQVTNGNGNSNGGSLSLETTEEDLKKISVVERTGNICSSCGNQTLYRIEGCEKCITCGYSQRC